MSLESSRGCKLVISTKLLCLYWNACRTMSIYIVTGVRAQMNLQTRQKILAQEHTYTAGEASGRQLRSTVCQDSLCRLHVRNSFLHAVCNSFAQHRREFS